MNNDHATIKGIGLVVLLLFFAFLPTVLSSRYFSGLPDRSVPILMYHNVTEDSAQVNSLTITADKFEADLRWLSDNGYETVLPRELAEGTALPEKPVIITFDDGYKSNYLLVFPLLKKYNLKGEISVIVSNIDDPAYEGFMDWDMLREMNASGLVEIGSHSYDLHNPGTSGEVEEGGRNGVQRRKGESKSDFQDRVQRDLSTSRELLEKELGCRVYTFSYPYGAKDLGSERIAESLFAVTLLTDPGYAQTAENLYDLKRLAVREDTELAELLKP